MSTDAIVGAIRESWGSRTPLRICGRSNWLTAGRPVRANKTLSLRDDAGIVGYVPGDLTLTVRAGTPLSEIERVTREHDQWLPLDPYGPPDGTIGATISTASSGPLAHNFGSPRDLLLGLEFVTGRGDVVRGGGKVVKNVAGFDLSRLLTGSWGTLGVITEVTVRLYARPKVDRTFSVTMDRGDDQPMKQVQGFRGAPIMPFALELVGPSTARTLGLGDRPAFLVRLGGNQAVVDSQTRVISQLGATQEITSQVWDRLRTLESDADAVIRFSNLPTDFMGTFQRPVFRDFPESFTYTNPIRGSVRVAIHSRDRDRLRNALPRDSDFDATQFGYDSAHAGRRLSLGAQIFERLPAELWPVLAPSAVTDPLSQGIRKAYDPRDLLNPGILGDSN